MILKPQAGEAVPFISDQIDRLIDIIEAVGAHWHVVGGSKVVHPALAFELPTLCNDTDEAWRAMHDFAEAFACSEDVRKATIEHAISVGAYYVEIGNDRPIVSDGRTVQ